MQHVCDKMMATVPYITVVALQPPWNSNDMNSLSSSLVQMQLLLSKNISISALRLCANDSRNTYRLALMAEVLANNCGDLLDYWQKMDDYSADYMSYSIDCLWAISVDECVDYLANVNQIQSMAKSPTATSMNSSSPSSVTLDLSASPNHSDQHCCDFDCYCIASHSDCLALGLGWTTHSIDNFAMPNTNNYSETAIDGDQRHQPLTINRLSGFRVDYLYYVLLTVMLPCYCCRLN